MAEAGYRTLTLGIDLGTSAVKLLAVDDHGVVWAAAAAEFPTFSTLPGQAEQDPADWTAAVSRAAADLDGALTGRDGAWRDAVAGIGLSGQLPTLVCLQAGSPLGRAITWKDSRADIWASTAVNAAERAALYRRTGMPIDGRYLGPMFRYHFHGRRDVEALLSAKDYLCYLLTGERLTDPSTAAGYGVFDLAAGAFDPGLAERWGVPRSAFPAIRPAHALAGPLTAAGARLLGLRAGIPVTVGSADSVASAFAMCGLQTGVVCITMGSSTVILDAVPERALDHAARYLLTPHVADGWYGREMDLLATGTGYAWLSALLGWSDGVLDRYAADSAPGAQGVTFAPYLAGGEQGVLWDATLRGSIHGLTVRHGASDLARAFLEGVCFEIRRCVDVLAEREPLRDVVVAGHIVNRPTSLGLLADILGRPVRPWTEASPAALGAALGARLLVEPATTVGEGCKPTDAASVAPGPDCERYGRLYEQYAARSWR